MKRIKKIIAVVMFWGMAGVSSGLAAEPSMADYTAYPVFMAQSVKPNILIILDNSGSMNYNAYGTWPGSNGTVDDEPYTCGELSLRVSNGRDDAEELVNGGSTWSESGDLDIGALGSGGSDPTIIAVRFQNVSIPRGATITNAYIEFEANANGSESASYTIWGEAADYPTQYSAGQWQNFIAGDNFDISTRSSTAASVPWAPSNWNSGSKYQTPDLKTIIQEIVNRDGWSEDSAMAFKIQGTGKRDAKSYNGSSSRAPRLYVEFSADCPRYYGYFDPDSQYSYSSQKFTKDPSGPWNGNWLNWLSMRRLDVLRKVIMGGLATSRTGGGNTTLIGEDTSYGYYKWHDSTGSTVSPYVGNYKYKVDDGEIKVYDSNGTHQDSFVIKVAKDEATEPEDFYGGNIAGILQRVGDKARWGNLWFNSGTGNNNDGGTLSNRVGKEITSIITDLENTGASGWTPLAESYYVAVQYFKQEALDSGLDDYPNGAAGSFNNTNDPYHHDGEFVECAKSFVILLTDGASTKDGNVPALMKNFDPDSNDNTGCNEDNGSNCDYPSGGTDYLDDIALYARTTDLRPDLGGEQNLYLYSIYAFGSDDNARNLLKDAARNGGFEDKILNNRPDGDYGDPAEDRREWDKDGDGNPDTYFEASDGYQLETQLLNAITNILQQASSGTSASVLSTSQAGDGFMVQAYFKPSVVSGLDEAKWLGYLQTLWIDKYGNLREDTVQDHIMNEAQDRKIEYARVDGDVKIKTYPVDGGDPIYMELHEVKPIWEAGDRLHQMDPADRNIFTYINKDNDSAVDEASYDFLDTAGEVVRFHTDAASFIKPYLGVMDGSAWAYLGASHDDRVNNLIDYIRGTDIDGLRNRTLDGSVWKLGDIIHSTPLTVSAPPENYHLIYKDQSYYNYFHKYKNRESVVYVGANDGVMHAFAGWSAEMETVIIDNKAVEQLKFEKPAGASVTEMIGDELWAYIPQALLPHLKWLPDKNYTHVYYADAKPIVFDARIIDNNTHYDDGNPGSDWGTLLMFGLNMGGRDIQVNGDFDYDGNTPPAEIRNFAPTYVCMDVTDPRNPRLLWERSYAGLGMSSSIPGIVKVGTGVDEKWFAVFGSGYTDYEGESNQNGRVYVVDLKTGEPYKDGTNDWRFTTSANAFLNSPSSLDKNLTFEVDSIYVGETYKQGANWAGQAWAISTRVGDAPVNDPGQWTIRSFFDAERPITAPMSLSIDALDNVWVYFGTGRFIGLQDKADDQEQFLFGIKDPLFHNARADGSISLGINDLLDVTQYQVTKNKKVFTGTDCIEWSEFLDNIRKYDNLDPENPDTTWMDGWRLSLTDGSPSERCVSKFSVLGGTVFVPTYTPNSDICGFGGSSNFFGLYFETGTSYYNSLLSDCEPGAVDCDGEAGCGFEPKIPLGDGAPPPTTGVHIGQEDGITTFSQMSSGEVVKVEGDTAIPVKNKVVNWIEK